MHTKKSLKYNIVKYLIAPSCQFPTNYTHAAIHIITSPPQCRTRTPTSSFQGVPKTQKTQNIRIGKKQLFKEPDK
jgi:hypothetical protein